MLGTVSFFGFPPDILRCFFADAAGFGGVEHGAELFPVYLFIGEPFFEQMQTGPNHFSRVLEVACGDAAADEFRFVVREVYLFGGHDNSVALSGASVNRTNRKAGHRESWPLRVVVRRAGLGYTPRFWFWRMTWAGLFGGRGYSAAVGRISFYAVAFVGNRDVVHDVLLHVCVPEAVFGGNV